MTTTEEINDILKSVQNPLTHRNIIEDGLVTAIENSENGKIEVKLNLQNDRKLQLAIEAQIRTALSKKQMAPDAVKVKFIGANTNTPKQPAPAAGGPPKPKRVDGVKQIVAVASGKGGVGKSTVSLNLALTLQKQGHKVGLLDADIYGPSLGKMLGKAGKVKLEIKNDKIVPFEFEGLKVMSFSFLIDEGQAVVWRGPMLGKAIEQFLYDIVWGSLDYLVIDLPPGTGDAQLSLAQLAEVDAAVIVTTPQNVALQDASRAIAMFEQVNIPVAGVVENMSEFICPHCQKGSHIFSTGGGKELAKSSEATLLGHIPLTIGLMKSAETGKPLTTAKAKIKDEDSKKVVSAFDQIATGLHEIMVNAN